MPLKNANGNCYFACVSKTGKPDLHTEKDLILIRIRIWHPGTMCISGGIKDKTTAELDEYKAVYYCTKMNIKRYTTVRRKIPIQL